MSPAVPAKTGERPLAIIRVSSLVFRVVNRPLEAPFAVLLRDLWITKSVTAEARTMVSSANLPNPARSGGYEELAAIACDPGSRVGAHF